MNNQISEDLLDIICCPSCQKDFKFKDNYLICTGCNKEFQIKDGIPILLLD